jgi:DNA-binding NtrC family response regulator
MDSPKPTKILIVDDEVSIADTLGTIFSNQGYEARVAYSAEQSIEIVAKWEPQLALIDVVLPAMNGVELAILLKANYPSIRVLLISGQIIAGTLVSEAAEHGHQFEILAKPSPVSELLDSAARLLAPRFGESQN